MNKKRGASCITTHLLCSPSDFPKLCRRRKTKQYRTKNNRQMEEGKNEIMELRQMIEGCFERQNKLIARLEMELEAGPPPRGKDVSCIPACTRTS